MTIGVVNILTDGHWARRGACRHGPTSRRAIRIFFHLRTAKTIFFYLRRLNPCLKCKWKLCASELKTISIYLNTAPVFLCLINYTHILWAAADIVNGGRSILNTHTHSCLSALKEFMEFMFGDNTNGAPGNQWIESNYCVPEKREHSWFHSFALPAHSHSPTHTRARSCYLQFGRKWSSPSLLEATIFIRFISTLLVRLVVILNFLTLCKLFGIFHFDIFRPLGTRGMTLTVDGRSRWCRQTNTSTN